MGIAENIAGIRARMSRAAEGAGRSPSDIMLLGASKINDAAACRAAIAAGIDALGENRVQEMTQKIAEHAYDGKPLHFIGHLQKNKARQVVGRVELIHSIDSMELLREVDKCAKKLGIVQDVLLEVNIGMEESKSGFEYDAVKPALDEADSLHGARVCGLMAIPPISSESGGNTPYFEKMRDLFVDIRPHLLHNSSKIYLSMGMSDDFEDAIAAGSTLIRVGTAIFGRRNYNI